VRSERGKQASGKGATAESGGLVASTAARQKESAEGVREEGRREQVVVAVGLWVWMSNQDERGEGAGRERRRVAKGRSRGKSCAGHDKAKAKGRGWAEGAPRPCMTQGVRYKQRSK
jgi:hypothetical protein